ncbi:MAG TPA: hypothetical protein VNT81_18745 [Vicinamibacterales bacterium]|nr:hypothetical protein [Vicinamibacterales bacterium]
MRSARIIAANTAILLLVAELVAHLGILAYRSGKPALSYATMSEPVKRNYSHRNRAEIDELWRDTLSARWRYEPIVGFVNEQKQSRFVNVNQYGVRSNGSGFHPVEGATWFFGGSTTFGYGVADDETIPAALERQLGQPVVNFGVPGHYSFHENRLLGQYLRLGFRPSRVLFLDGVNESCEADLAEDELGDLVAQSQSGYHWQPSRPAVSALRLLLNKTLRTTGMMDDAPDTDLRLSCHSAGRDFPLADLHARALVERASLCGLYNIDCRTFIQPFAGLHGRHDQPDEADVAGARYLRALYQHLEPVWKRAGVSLVTGALDGLARHAYIDDAHYSPEAHRLIAGAMAGQLRAVTP